MSGGRGRAQSADPPSGVTVPGASRPAGPIPLPPELGVGRLEIVASPFHVQRITLRRLLYEEQQPAPSAAGAPAPVGEPVNVDAQLFGRVVLFAEGCEVTLDVRVTPDPARTPIQVEAAVSAFVGRPDGMADVEFARLMGEIGPRLVFPYARQAITQVTALGLYGPLNLDLLNVRLVWDAPPAGPADAP